MAKCSYCNKESNNLKKVGSTLQYCKDTDCYYGDCVEKHPGTSLAKIISRITGIAE